ncbi:hypothetical protein B0T20DRAFT_223593 [Sordaria brevicollis]|uniref:Uncharacterized protein n=1 Tax=Sordaria brevicollis TaxID=83679 RepID=A0AAE0PCS8_SORBR|nr:hypothetical protein B0T20DRAFT_223593 [Sordaria brevicollis]
MAIHQKGHRPRRRKTTRRQQLPALPSNRPSDDAATHQARRTSSELICRLLIRLRSTCIRSHAARTAHSKKMMQPRRSCSLGQMGEWESRVRTRTIEDERHGQKPISVSAAVAVAAVRCPQPTYGSIVVGQRGWQTQCQPKKSPSTCHVWVRLCLDARRQNEEGGHEGVVHHPLGDISGHLWASLGMLDEEKKVPRSKRCRVSVCLIGGWSSFLSFLGILASATLNPQIGRASTTSGMAFC